MSPFRTRLFQLLTPEPARHLPARGDDFAQWIQQQRDQQQDQYGATPVWWALDSILTAYHVHADRRLPLGAHVCEAQVAAHCTCTSQRRPF